MKALHALHFVILSSLQAPSISSSATFRNLSHISRRTRAVSPFSDYSFLKPYLLLLHIHFPFHSGLVSRSSFELRTVARVPTFFFPPSLSCLLFSISSYCFSSFSTLSCSKKLSLLSWRMMASSGEGSEREAGELRGRWRFQWGGEEVTKGRENTQHPRPSSHRHSTSVLSSQAKANAPGKV